MLHKLLLLFMAAYLESRSSSAEAVKSYRWLTSTTITITTIIIITFPMSPQTVRFAFALELPLRALSVWPENSTTSASFSLSTSLNFLPSPIRTSLLFSGLRPLPPATSPSPPPGTLLPTVLVHRPTR